MTEMHGGLEIPLPVSDLPKGRDELLFYMLGFFQAVGNRYAQAEWANIAPNLQVPPLPITTTYDHDPAEYYFNENQLPSLFLVRARVTDRLQLAQDVRIERGVMRLIWVPPVAVQPTRLVRGNFAAKLFKVLDDLLERGRDPSFIVPGDDNANAADRGSLLHQYAKYRRFHIGQMRSLKLSIQMRDPTVSTQPRDYEAYECECPYEEEITLDPIARGYVTYDETIVNVKLPPDDDHVDPLEMVGFDEIEA